MTVVQGDTVRIWIAEFESILSMLGSQVDDSRSRFHDVSKDHSAQRILHT
jgi:hypothetical protein